MTFKSDLELGKVYEEIAISMLKDEVIEHRPEGKFKEYDFKTNKAIYEVKSDRLTQRYGNFFIEFECSGQKSGISTTKADYWYYFVILPLSLSTYPNNYRAYRVPTSYIWKLIDENPTIKSGGDGYRSKGYVIPESKFKEFIVQIGEKEQ